MSSKISKDNLSPSSNHARLRVWRKGGQDTSSPEGYEIYITSTCLDIKWTTHSCVLVPIVHPLGYCWMKK